MATDKLKLPSYGGQALLEGVLMRGSSYVAAAMRAPDGHIVVKSEALQGIYKSKIAKLPVLRGLVLLWDALVLGTRYLVESANAQLDDNSSDQSTLPPLAGALLLPITGGASSGNSSGKSEKIEGVSLFSTIGVSLLIAVGIFFILPVILGDGIGKLISASELWRNVIEGAIRLIFLLLYIWGIGKMKDIERFFAYHGAEHKTINAFEAGVEMTVENVMQYPLEHPRCGTGFLLSVMVISVLVFALLGPLPLLYKILSRLLLLPVVVVLAYEYMRWTANHLDSPIVRILVKPNLLLQRLTTRPPTPDMVEVALTSFKTMLQLEQGQTTVTEL